MTTAAVPTAPYTLKVLKVLRSPQGWAVVPVHYSHDKAKGVDWYQAERAKYSTQAAWDQEMEIDFTSVKGARAYPNWIGPLHISDKVEVDPKLPLFLCCDFNVSPCAWVVAQRQRWDGRDVLVAIDEVVLDPGPIAEMATTFDMSYRGRTSMLSIYGDAAGRSRSVQTAFTDYDLVLQYLRHWPKLSMMVPKANPAIRDRLNAVNAALLDAKGIARTFVHPRCTELIEDFGSVVLDERTRLVAKSTRSDDPYRRRTHTSDAWGYMVWCEMPVPADLGDSGELVDFWARPSKRAKPRVLGELT